MDALVITGPTATGKSAVAIELAHRINGEIISADSMMIYTHMNIGTAKPKPEEMKGIKHHLIDIISPDNNFSVADYRKLALECINIIHQKNKVPIITGGTGLYINSLVHGIDYTITASDPAIRKRLQKEAENIGYESMHVKLQGIDPETASKLHPADKKRIIRALEVFEVSGTTMSVISRLAKVGTDDLRFYVFGLFCERSQLYDKINKRVDEMMSDGLLNEVHKLRENGYLKQGQTSAQAIGYKELCAFLDGLCSYEEAVEKIKSGTRKYAKRQMTWFRKTEGLIWVDISDFSNPDDIAASIEKMLHNLQR